MSEEIISLKEIYNEDWSSAYRACNEWISNIVVKPEHIDLVSGVALISYEGDQCFKELSIENQLAEEVIIEINNGSGKFEGSIRSEKDSRLTVKVKENIFIGKRYRDSNGMENTGASTENISRLVLESEGGVYLGEIKHGRTLSIESNNLVAFGVSYAADFRVKTNDLINIYGVWHTQNNNTGVLTKFLDTNFCSAENMELYLLQF